MSLFLLIALWLIARRMGAEGDFWTLCWLFVFVIVVTELLYWLFVIGLIAIPFIFFL